jgi:predicted ABC-type ATPase
MARLRVFAGPNGSGKSTLNEHLRGEFNFGYYVNADDIKKKADLGQCIDLSEYNLSLSDNDLSVFLSGSLYANLLLSDGRLNKIWLKENKIQAFLPLDSYTAAIIADFIKQKLLEKKDNFSFETVFSHPSKIEFIQRANLLGYRTYLYYIATNSPEINVSRVEQRELSGGHTVPVDKIIDRYQRSLGNLLPAIRNVYRAYIFDNSGRNIKLVAEVNPNKKFLLLTKQIPEWLMYNVVDKLK